MAVPSFCTGTIETFFRSGSAPILVSDKIGSWRSRSPIFISSSAMVVGIPLMTALVVLSFARSPGCLCRRCPNLLRGPKTAPKICW